MIRGRPQPGTPAIQSRTHLPPIPEHSVKPRARAAVFVSLVGGETKDADIETSRLLVRIPSLFVKVVAPADEVKEVDMPSFVASPISIESTAFIRIWNPKKGMFEERNPADMDAIAKNNKIGVIAALYSDYGINGSKYVNQLKNRIEDIKLADMTRIYNQMVLVLQNLKSNGALATHNLQPIIDSVMPPKAMSHTSS